MTKQDIQIAIRVLTVIRPNVIDETKEYVEAIANSKGFFQTKTGRFTKNKSKIAKSIRTSRSKSVVVNMANADVSLLNKESKKGAKK
jgi:CRISPR/Cas system CSM-associated protein Csm2 small subunit